MIERKIVAQKLKEYQIQEFIAESLRNSGQSHTKVQRTPMGEKIIVFTSRPGMIVGRKGQNIKKLTLAIKKKFDLENPQIEIAEVENINLDPQIVAERIVLSLERFGSARFKGIVHKVMEDVIHSGALGIEVVISGKVPSTRAKSWRFNQGYLKKCGDIAQEGVLKSYGTAKLKSGVIGIKVKIMPPSIKLPDRLEIVEPSALSEENAEKKVEEKISEKKETKEKKSKKSELSEEKEEKKEEKEEKKEEKKPRKPRTKKVKSELHSPEKSEKLNETENEQK